ncbi:GH3 auxin-responsive promoter [Arcticibacter tournemirensis]|uniref:GH3 auxin-responsive promoter family protein n=1 Tax=Arcticibacter tournemirensis TaxID=699437 RepID=A0A5M9H6N8_9SPHI|nr:GH3 auxin-responsive promoter family protein [Arcticibacter tournemirensis]KAA8482603.1 GH3 auxin-responsive promoter family protein [Arcticibacter tournemirensis]TQM52578.1 GH3 auxin-responsive promoter [Arcticibacter tournemirensis]
MTFVNSIFTWFMKKRMHQIDLFVKYPHDVQDEVFRNLIASARTTEWGKLHNYDYIFNQEQFKQAFPVQSYETLKPYIERMMKGEQNILWSSEINWFAKSSGTTNDRSKFIPVSAESLEECHYKGGKDMLSIYCNNRPDSMIFTGKSLALGGSHQVNNLNENIFYGDLSAVLIKNLPFWAEFYRTPDMSITLMDNYEQKIDAMARATEHVNVTNISGVPTWTVVLAKQLLELTEKDNLLEIWPNLELYIHGAVKFTPYREQFRKLIPSDSMYYLETYNASEGFFGIQDLSDSEEMLLMLDYGIFYEFLPMENFGDENPSTLGLSEVEINKNYALIISTNGGLWRYMIGDTIKFTSLSPFRIQITGRTKHFINAFGEEVIIDNAEKALTKACSETGAIIRDYTACPIYFEGNDAGGHEWIIEFEQMPNNIEIFTDTLDNTLREINSDYDAKRFKDMALRRPLIHIAPEGTFYNWLKSLGKLGGQHKVPRLANERQYVEQILLLMKKKG